MFKPGPWHIDLTSEQKRKVLEQEAYVEKLTRLHAKAHCRAHLEIWKKALEAK